MLPSTSLALDRLGGSAFGFRSLWTVISPFSIRRSGFWSRYGRGSRGAVTAELAVGIPAVILLLGVLLTAMAGGVTQLRVEEAARAAARDIARGEPSEVASATVRRVAGDGATLEISAEGVVVRVRVRVAVPGPLAGPAGVVAEAKAALPAEAGSLIGNR